MTRRYAHLISDHTQHSWGSSSFEVEADLDKSNEGFGLQWF